jgi:hypothetical protein
MIYAVVRRDEFNTIVDVKASCHQEHSDAEVFTINYGKIEWCAYGLRVQFIDIMGDLNNKFPARITVRFQVRCIPIKNVLEWMEECVNAMDTLRRGDQVKEPEIAQYVVNYIETFLQGQIDSIINSQQD